MENVNLQETAFNFDRYDWKDGSITGTGLQKMIDDTERWNSKTNAVKIYDRNTGKWYNIIDSNIDQKNSGLVLQIDSSKESNGKSVLDDMLKEWTEAVRNETR